MMKSFVEEDFEIRLSKTVKDFKESSKTELPFPANLSNKERQYIHKLCRSHGLKSKSSGKGENRFLTISKKTQDTSAITGNGDDDEFAFLPKLKVSEKATKLLDSYLAKFPALEKEQKLKSSDEYKYESGFDKTNIQGNNGNKTVVEEDFHLDVHEQEEEGVNAGVEFPEIEFTVELDTAVAKSRLSLPIWSKRSEILSCVYGTAAEAGSKQQQSVSLTLITGETGCGKSTQVPQFLLNSSRNSKIICTQPRRLSAIALADRVAIECGEQGSGGLVGYTVRHDSNVSSLTRLTFCTTGTLLRSMNMNYGREKVNARQLPGMLREVTHLVMDEVHERDCNSDFLLILVRNLMKINPMLRLVLMSATVKAEKFKSYFTSAPYEYICRHVHVPGSMFPINVHHLPEILGKTGYMNQLMKKDGRIKNYFEEFLNHGCELENEPGEVEEDNELQSEAIESLFPVESKLTCSRCGQSGFQDAVEMGIHAASCMGNQNPGDDDAYEDVWGNDANDENDSDDSDENIHAPDVEEQESIFVATRNSDSGSTELDNHYRSLALAKTYQYSKQIKGYADDMVVDVDLLISLLEFIHLNNDEMDVFTKDGIKLRPGTASNLPVDDTKGDIEGQGAVLIFVSGWFEISLIMEKLTSHPIFGNKRKFALFPLHSGVSNSKQRGVFQKPPNNIRKIIVSTNIAETSLTIDDIIYVIDTGIHKSRDYDPHTNVSSLLPQFISKASAIQRSGRAGRCREGVCFRMYSEQRYASFIDEQLPEMQRISLEEVCLQVSMLLEKNIHMHARINTCVAKTSRIIDFLRLAMDPPKELSIGNALKLLHDIGALNVDEKITDLGRILARVPLHPSMGKMLLVGYLLGYFEDSLTLCSFHSVSKEPFVIAQNAFTQEKQKNALKALTNLNGNPTESDHVVMLRLWDAWFSNSKRYKFCNDIGLSSVVMETIRKTREQLKRDMNQIFDFNARGYSEFCGRVNSLLCHYDNGNNGDDIRVLEGLVCIGTAPNLAVCRPGSKWLKTGLETGVRMQKNSALKPSANNVNYKWVVFDEMTRSRMYCTIRGCCKVEPLSVLFFCGVMTVRKGDETRVIVKIGDFAEFLLERSLAQKLLLCKIRFEQAFQRSLSARNKRHNNRINKNDIEVVALVHSLLCSEDQMQGCSIHGAASTRRNFNKFNSSGRRGNWGGGNRGGRFREGRGRRENNMSSKRPDNTFKNGSEDSSGRRGNWSGGNRGGRFREGRGRRENNMSSKRPDNTFKNGSEDNWRKR